MIEGIVILGMHRGGTSVTAEVVHRWGAHGGPEGVQGLIKASRWNARGYWEYAPFIALNEDLLAAVGCTWECPPDKDEESILGKLGASGPYRERALHLLKHMRSTGRIWFLKDPRLSLLLPFWQQIFGQVAYVIVVRHPFEVAMSLNRRNGLNVWAGSLLWHRHMTSALHLARTAPARILVSYRDFIENPRAQCVRLSTFLDEHAGKSASSTKHQAMLKAVDRRLNTYTHHGTQAYTLPSQLFNLLDELALSGEPWPDLSSYHLGPAWRDEFLALSQTAAPGAGYETIPAVLLRRVGL